MTWAQQRSVIKEYDKDYITYPFSDPNPLPVFGKIYPYFRFDGYTTKADNQVWKIVELENDFLQIKIFPEIGGKIWSVYDKVAGKEMFYDNDVVKFRDISLRGPWTSGGIEFNYGVVGHSPGCSFPVDYLTRTNEDGSVSCIIGILDLLTRTRWSVDINLPKDKGWFTTRSFWHNSTPAAQPYYNWVNTGITAKDDLKFTYPGTHIIRHDGVTFPWPTDEERNKNLSVWKENDFIGSKSYHITGSNRPYFGAYWSDDDFGIMQYATRDNKVGRKIFSWALSDQGKIWEDLLTDTKGQYVELQSGRLFNQNMVISSRTPYKQILFTPYATDVWNEYWFPYHGTGGVSDASLYGVVKVETKQDRILFSISPLQYVSDRLRFYDPEDQLLYEENVELVPARPFTKEFRTGHVHRVTLANTDIWNKDDKNLERPVVTTEEFDWNTAYGNYLQGRDLSGLRLYEQAESHIKKSLAFDPDFVPSLSEMAFLYHQRMKYDSAFICAKKALSIDQYDARANYEYGRSAKQLGEYDDALDGFELATLTIPLRSAAYTELSKLYFSKKQFDKALEYAEKSLINNIYNIEGIQMSYLSKVETGGSSANLLSQIEKLDPLNPFVPFEKYYADKSEAGKKAFLKGIKCELPAQTFLELAIMYYNIGLTDRSKEILSIFPEKDGEISYWLAFLNKDSGEVARYMEYAEKENPAFVFPFRQESQEVFDWAISAGKSWKPVYYLA
jgi:tetratricopeptide (TPR) repeat protein